MQWLSLMYWVQIPPADGCVHKLILPAVNPAEQQPSDLTAMQTSINAEIKTNFILTESWLLVFGNIPSLEKYFTSTLVLNLYLNEETPEKFHRWKSINKKVCFNLTKHWHKSQLHQQYSQVLRRCFFTGSITNMTSESLSNFKQ